MRGANQNASCPCVLLYVTSTRITYRKSQECETPSVLCRDYTVAESAPERSLRLAHNALHHGTLTCRVPLIL